MKLTDKEKFEVYMETAAGNAYDIITEMIDNIDYKEYKELYWRIEAIRMDLNDIWSKFYYLNRART